MLGSTRIVAGCLALFGLLAACEVQPANEPVEIGDTAPEPADVVVAWPADSLAMEELTMEEVERHRYDDSWRRAVSIDTFGMAGRDSAGASEAIPPETIPSDSILIPESWQDIGATVRLPLGGRVEGPSVLYVQILLDRAHFSPGAIDGRWGMNTEKAVYWLQRREGIPATGIVDSLTFNRLTDLAGRPDRFISPHVLTAEEVGGPFVEIPADIYAQAQMDCLCYRSLSEKLAERFHVTPDLLARLNPAASLDSLAAGDTLQVPYFARSTPTGANGEIARLVISDQGFYVHAVDGEGRILYHFPSTLGSTYDPSPEGELEITSIAEDPWFYYQPDLLSGVPDTAEPARLPPGPNNPVGIVWMQLSADHYGIHGTREPAAIGYETSSGCIRLTNWDAGFLGDRLATGTPVEFVDLAEAAGHPGEGTEPDSLD